MSIQANPYPLRLEQQHMEKIRTLAKQGRRSVNMQLCIAVETYLEQDSRRAGTVKGRPRSRGRPLYSGGLFDIIISLIMGRYAISRREVSHAEK